jgi:amino acid transporter
MTQLPRQLGARSALAVLVSMIIGSGIFRVPRVVAEGTGSTGGIALCWIVGGIIALCGVLAVAELASMFPRAGGMYVYLRESYGDVPAFMLGWVDLLALPLAQAALALVFAAYFGSFVPLNEAGTRLVAGGLIILVGLVNYRSLRLAAVLQNIGTPAKVLALLALSVTIFAFGHGGGALTRGPFEYAPRSLGGFGVALIAVLFSYDGWAQFSSLAGEIRDPGRTLPRVLVGGMLLVIVVYLVANAAYLYVLPIADMAASRMVAADALRRAVGPVGGSVVSGLVLLSTFGALNSLMMAEPRLFYAMAEDGLFFGAISAVHPRNHTPHRAIVLTTTLALFYVGFRSFEQLAEGFVIATWPFFTLAVAGVLVLRRRRPDLARPYRTVGYPGVPLVFVGAGILIVGNAVVQHPASTLTSFAVTLLAWPMYRVWSRHPGMSRRADVAARQASTSLNGVQ